MWGLGTLGGGGVLVGVSSTIHSDPWRGGGGLGKVRSTIVIKKCHDMHQKVHLPIYEQHNKPMILLNLVCCCDDNLS